MRILVWIGLPAALLVSACHGLFHAGHDGHDHGAARVTEAMCVLYPTAGNSVQGVITFRQVGDRILLEGEVTGLTPGKHGFHVHQWGNVTGSDGTATGGHFNPGGHDHGGPDASERHVGDLGNIEADASGVARIRQEDSVLSFSGPNSIIGRSIIVHAGEDDLTSQPTGAAGARVAQGVIGVSAEE